MKQLFTFWTCIFLGAFANIQAQNVGLRYNSGLASDGYVLFSPERNNDVYLVDACGEMVNKWTFGELPALVCYLLEDGSLVRAGKDTIQRKDWNNNLTWSYALDANLGVNQHHDIEVLPNGNVLALLFDFYTNAEMYAQGKDTVLVSGEHKLDRIIELQPVGLDSAVVVWDWKYMDHFIQDIDNTRPNFGVIADHPELLDINFPTNFGVDHTHGNAIDYNADLDHIIISARSLNEVMIIDHSTTTAEAAGHTGGNSGRGGDFLWRWGNPIVYQQGTAADQKLFLQHDPKWIPNGYADAGSISIFSNAGVQTSPPSSEVVIVEPTFENGAYTMQNGTFLPVDFVRTWSGEILGDTMREGKKCGVNVMPNGNFVVCETSKGQVSEISPTGEVLWVYKNPAGLTIYNQGDIILNSNNSLFRAEKYPSTFPGFQGQDMSVKGTIEIFNILSDTCDLETGILAILESDVQIVNPVLNGQIEFIESQSFDEVQIINLNGQILESFRNVDGRFLPIDLSTGMYIIRMKTTRNVSVKSFMVY